MPPNNPHSPGQSAGDNPIPNPPHQPAGPNDAAVELIRKKLAAIYRDEPDAKQELARAEAKPLPGQHHSRHQQYMHSLHASGKPMAEIQTLWHQYYQQLNDDDKRQVWQEFYNQSAQARQRANRIEPRHEQRPETTANPLYTGIGSSQPNSEPEPEPEPTASQPPVATDHRSPNAIRSQIRNTVSSRGALKAKHHIQSLAFGLGFGALALLVVLFGFFNEVVIAPFIQPSRTVSATPIIVSPDGATASAENKIIIPKINVEIPLDFSAVSTEEKAFEAALDKGVAHYPTTALPGQQGNASFFGHSSNNIFNPGQYKFAFVLLNELVAGDTFYLTYNGTTYTYQVYDKRIVEATAVEILNPVAGKASTAMLVTCDPPGTSLRRLAVWGEQVSPNPAQNPVAPPAAPTTATEDLPGNGPTLWRRILNTISGN